jgi:hypothetical protein
VFFAFARQVCKAVEENPPTGKWTGERSRRALTEYLASLAEYVYNQKRTESYVAEELYNLRRVSKVAIEKTPQWGELQAELKRIAEQHHAAAIGKAKQQSRLRGYRDPIRAWMADHQIPSVKIAAKRLGVSESVLKSMMTSKGKIRHSEESLRTVLEKIGYSAERTGDLS